MISKFTYTQKFYEHRLYELAKESGQVYTQMLIFFKKVLKKKKLWLSKQSLYKYINSKVERNLLHSQSYQASYEKLFDNLKAYKEAIREYRKTPSKFEGQPRLPRKRRFFQPITFKKSAIKYENGYLFLSLSKGNAPIKVLWNENLPIPINVSINWNKEKRYWQLNLVLEKECAQITLDKTKTLAIDLGVKRIATTYDGSEAITFSGKKVKSLITGRNKLQAKTQSKLSKLKKNSRKYKKVQKAHKRVNLRTDNKITDILHKTSTTIVNHAIKNDIGKIAIGDCASVHTNTNCGKRNNQQITQNPEQRLRKYIEYKFESIGGMIAIVPEHYTSQTCPSCCQRNKPKDRVYRCLLCKFLDDRDVVGAKNIYKVSFGIDVRSVLDVIGILTIPIGWKYDSNRDCKIA